MVIVTLLCGCMNSPNKSIVISKADGGFDEKMRISSDIQHCQSENQEQIYTGNFHSTDNSVEFVLDIDTTVKNCDMPVVEVVPHYLSEADAQRVAKALFATKSAMRKNQYLQSNFQSGKYKTNYFDGQNMPITIQYGNYLDKSQSLSLN